MLKLMRPFVNNIGNYARATSPKIVEEKHEETYRLGSHHDSINSIELCCLYELWHEAA